MMLISSTGLALSIVLSAHKLTKIELKRTLKLIGFITIAVCYGAVISINTIFIDKFNNHMMQIHTGFTIASLIIAFGIIYSVILVTLKKSNIDKAAKPILNMLFAVVIIILPAALIFNFMEFSNPSNVPIAFSPLVYLLINTAIVYNSVIYLSKKKLSSAEKEYPSFDGLAAKYNITDREYEIMILVTEGATNQVIGDKLYISPNTVRNHVSNIYKKLMLSNRFELINFMMNGDT